MTRTTATLPTGETVEIARHPIIPRDGVLTFSDGVLTCEVGYTAGDITFDKPEPTYPIVFGEPAAQAPPHLGWSGTLRVRCVGIWYGFLGAYKTRLRRHTPIPPRSSRHRNPHAARMRAKVRHAR